MADTVDLKDCDLRLWGSPWDTEQLVVGQTNEHDGKIIYEAVDR